MFLQTPAVTGNTNAEAMKQMGFENLMQNFDWLGWVVFVTLVAMSFLSWYFIIANGIRNATVKARADKVIDGFWANGSTQDAIRELEAQPKSEPFSKIALEAASAVAHHQQTTAGTTGRLAESLSRSEFIDRALRQSVARESMRLEGGMTLLATVGSAAPFVGLLGTVWGIYHALIGIAATGNASMNAVAGPVGEALIMTAFGLFAAIPALFAYNFFNRSNRVVYARFDEFANDLHDFFATGSRIESAK
ncbi:MAG: MotA/TolQ/ExbB proton channel family protein [Rhodanobacter sp.]|nr:MAG: MotA/TolQ/ExbB proton channel family protein [Rhodanobacter sp.]TAM01612.1 MAG: MotA/TolQ/ExbB proton channel family protein [Rhodanobacter sp.]TAM43032.1 MAG: MotA/TolQ/ExbB proton channel family protein [Rhodanobacter sp.]TAN25567.1 MAG: MotA/TolQ/ExbB proton channel family protein [Rhodanobacter sp.]